MSLPLLPAAGNLPSRQRCAYTSCPSPRLTSSAHRMLHRATSTSAAGDGRASEESSSPSLVLPTAEDSGDVSLPNWLTLMDDRTRMV